MKRWSTSLLRKIQIKTTVRHHFALKIAKTLVGITSPSIHEDVEQLVRCQLVQTFWGENLAKYSKDEKYPSTQQFYSKVYKS